MGNVILPQFLPNMVKPSLTTAISELAVGSIVKIKEDGVPVECLKVNQGVPSSLYDASCDGAWLLRIKLDGTVQWSPDSNDFEISRVLEYMNGQWYESLDAVAKSVIKTVKIPYRPGSGGKPTPINGGGRGLAVKVFPISGVESGLSSNSIPKDGAVLDYFKGTNPNGPDERRIASDGFSNYPWATRSPVCEAPSDTIGVVGVTGNGGPGGYRCTDSLHHRECIVVTNSALVDNDGNLLGTGG